LETDPLININDARTYVVPIANIIGKRLNRISTLKNKLITLVAKLYMIPDSDDKTEICNDIAKTISEIEILVLKNIDDTQILEYSLAEFAPKTLPFTEKSHKTESTEPHTYFA
jgi:hypothetical protein